MIFTHNIILFIFPIITQKMAKISDPYKTVHLLVSSWFVTELLWYQNTPQNLKTSVPRLKPSSNSVKDCPKTVPKILSRSNYQKTVPKFSSDCSKTVPKIPKNSYTQSQKFGIEIYSLSRSLSKSQMTFRLEIT